MLKNCPSCWREIKFEEKYARILACPYCNSILEFGTGELTKIWEQWEFIEFPSQFQIWKTIDWEEKKVYVKGRLRYEYDWGFFDEFFVEIDWKTYFIKEDDWLTKLFKKWDWQKENIDFENIRAWETIKIFWKDIFIMETWIFKLTWIKGFVNSLLIVWKEYKYLDWVLNGKVISLEWEKWSHRIRINEEVEV